MHFYLGMSSKFVLSQSYPSSVHGLVPLHDLLHFNDSMIHFYQFCLACPVAWIYIYLI